MGGKNRLVVAVDEKVVKTETGSVSGDELVRTADEHVDEANKNAAV